MISLPSTPMPGENGETFENGEDTGENLNPYFDEEAWGGIGTPENTGSEIEAATDESIESGAQADAQEDIDGEKYDDALSETIVDKIDNNEAINLNDIKNSVNEQYIDGAIEQSNHELAKEGSTDMIDDPDDDTNREKLKAAEVAASATAITALDGAERMANGETVDSEEITGNIEKATELAQKVNTIANSGNVDTKDVATAQNIVTQANQMATEAEQILDETTAKNELESSDNEKPNDSSEEPNTDPSDSDKGETAPNNGADNWTPDLSGAIFGKRR